MPNPTPSDLHVSVPLTNVAVAWRAQNRDEYISDRVFPNVPVQKQGDKFWKFHLPDWRRTNAAIRAPRTESVGIGWRVTTDLYYADVYAVHSDIDDRQRANADSFFALDRIHTEQVMMDMHLRREKDWHESYFTTGVWDTDLVGGVDFTKFSDTASTPIELFRTRRRTFKRLTGFTPNFIVWGPLVEDVLFDHASIIERIKYTQRGVLTRDLLASFFEVDNIYTSQAVENTAEEHEDLDADDTNANYQFVGAEDGMLLGYATGSPSTQNPSAGYTFAWRGYLGATQAGVRVKRFRQEAIASDRIEGEMAYDQKVVAPELGVFFSDATD